MRLLRKTRAALSLLLLILLTGQSVTATGYYRGFIGEEPWQFELSIDEGAVRCRLTHDYLPLQLEAGGSFDAGDSSVVARFGLSEGQLQGTLLGGPDESGTFQGTYLSPSGVEQFTFEQVAVYVDYSFNQEQIQATSTYPFFTSPRLQDLNDHVQPDLMAEQIQFVQRAQQAGVDGLIRHDWWFDSRARIEYAAPGLLSTLVTVSDYTGGAHPTLNYWSYNLAMTGTRLRPFELADLFAEDSDWLPEISDILLAELADQGADWVKDGSVDALTETDLQVFVISPIGLQFILAPYQVGPWASGTFTVRIPLADISELLDPEGPARLLSRSYGTDD